MSIGNWAVRIKALENEKKAAKKEKQYKVEEKRGCNIIQL